MNSAYKLAALASLLCGVTLGAIAQSDTSSSQASSSEASSSSSSTSSSTSSSSMSSSSSGAPSSSSSREPGNGNHPVNFGGLISALQTCTAIDLTVITDATVVNVVTVTTIKDNGNLTALDNAIRKNQTCITSLRGQVVANAAIMAKLQAAGFDSAGVLAVVLEADGTVTVYVDDRA
jgi:hypothetical protein